MLDWAYNPLVSKIVLAGNTGGGKSLLATRGFLIACMRLPPGQDYDCMAIGAKFSSIETNIIYKYLLPFLREAGIRHKYDKGGRPSVDFYRRGDLISVKLFGASDPADQQAIQGLNAAHMLGDEFAIWDEEPYMEASKRMRGIPAWANARSKMFLTCNPREPRHWAKKKVVDEHIPISNRI